jgi:hypothetical protein
VLQADGPGGERLGKRPVSDALQRTRSRRLASRRLLNVCFAAFGSVSAVWTHVRAALDEKLNSDTALKLSVCLKTFALAWWPLLYDVLDRPDNVWEKLPPLKLLDSKSAGNIRTVLLKKIGHCVSNKQSGAARTRRTPAARGQLCQLAAMFTSMLYRGSFARFESFVRFAGERARRIQAMPPRDLPDGVGKEDLTKEWMRLLLVAAREQVQLPSGPRSNTSAAAAAEMVLDDRLSAAAADLANAALSSRKLLRAAAPWQSCVCLNITGDAHLVPWACAGQVQTEAEEPAAVEGTQRGRRRRRSAA